MPIHHMIHAIRWNTSTRRSSGRASRSSSSDSCLPNCSTASIDSIELWQTWRRIGDLMDALIRQRPRVARLIIRELEALLDRLDRRAQLRATRMGDLTE